MGFFVLELLLRVGTYRPPKADLLRPGQATWWYAQVAGRIRYLFTPLMLIDLLTILALVPALRALRAVRLFRLLRRAHLFRYSNPYLGFLRTFEENSLLYMAVFGFLAANVAVGGVSLFLAEAGANPSIKTVGDGMWWALVTLTTVGYGDITPVTGVGKAVASVMMVGGMFTLAVFAGLVGSTLLNAMLHMKEDQFRMSSYANHIVVCGYDEGTRLLLQSLLAEMRGDEHPVVLFADRDRPRDLPAEFAWIPGDPTKASELAKARVRWARGVIVVGSRQTTPQEADARTILTVFTIRSWLNKWKRKEERDRPLYIVAEVLDTENVEHTRSAGADEVIETDRIGFDLLAHAVLSPGSADILSRVASAGHFSVFSGRYPYSEATTYRDILRRLHSEHQATLLGIRRKGSEEVLLDFDDFDPVGPDDVLIYLAKEQALKQV